MKITYRIPTEMYAYVEIEQEFKDTAFLEKDMPTTIRAAYDDFSTAFKEKPLQELNVKDFNSFIDKQLLGQPNHIETYNQMSPQQKETAQTIKRALARIEAANNKQ